MTDRDYLWTFLRTGVIVGFVAAIFQLFPSGDGQGRMLAHHQLVTLAAMEGRFYTQPGAPVALVGQPDITTGILTIRLWSPEF